MEDIGARLKLLREKRRLTQKELAEKANCSAQKISSYENGRNLIQICDFKNICNILDIDINYLIDGKKYHGKVTDNKDSQIVSAYDKLSYSDNSFASLIPLFISSSVCESIHTLLFSLPFTPIAWSTNLYIYSPSRPESVAT